jgi:hypothetical protein
MRFARGDMRGPHRFTQKRPRSFVWALRSIAVVEPDKNQLFRDLRRRSIFDFCNTIPPRTDIISRAYQVRKVPDVPVLFQPMYASGATASSIRQF